MEQTMKHLYTLWALLILLFSVNTHAITIDVVPEQPAINTGSLLSVAVNISGLNENVAPSLGVFDLDFYFDNSLFSFNSLSWGDRIKGNQLDLNGSGSLQSDTLATGIINLFELSFDDIDSLNNAQAGEFTLFTLAFDAIAPGTGNFSIEINQLGDAEGKFLVAENVKGTQVNVNSVSVPEPSSFLLLLGLLAIIALRTKLTTK
jgi:hypothetical protein